MNPEDEITQKIYEGDTEYAAEWRLLADRPDCDPLTVAACVALHDDQIHRMLKQRLNREYGAFGGSPAPVSGKVHDLKCYPVPFSATWEGLKSWEIRMNDRDYKVGDRIDLREWDPKTEHYTTRVLGGLIIWMAHGGDGKFGIPEGYVIMSIDYGDQT